jgi:hypothetical protein
MSVVEYISHSRRQLIQISNSEEYDKQDSRTASCSDTVLDLKLLIHCIRKIFSASQHDLLSKSVLTMIYNSLAFRC